MINRFLGLILLGLLLSSTTHALDTNILQTVFKKVPDKIFNYRSLRCYLKGITLPEEFLALRQAMPEVNPVEKTSGEYVFRGHVISTEKEGILVIDPERGIWAAYLDGQVIRYFSTGGGFFERVHPAVLKWRESVGGHPIRRPSLAKVTGFPLMKCRPAKKKKKPLRHARR